MKRFHVHVGVSDLDRSIAFYSGLFGMPPTVRKSDYAKWMVEDPRLNFAISQRGTTVGVDHLGLQAEDATELEAIRAAFVAADANGVVAQPDASCCYARSDKHWLTDPQGIAWEGYHSLGQVEIYGGATRAEAGAAAGSGEAPAEGKAACCAPPLRQSATAGPGQVPAESRAACCAPAPHAAAAAAPATRCCA